MQLLSITNLRLTPDDPVLSYGGALVALITDGSWIAFEDFNFAAGATSIDLIAEQDVGGIVEVRLDSPTGDLVGTIDVTGAPGSMTYETFTGVLTEAVEGVHDLYFVFTSGAGYLMEITDFTVSTSAIVVSDLDTPITAILYDDESHPGNDSFIRVAGAKIGNVKNGTWVVYNDFNFDTGAASVEVSAGCAASGGTIEFRLGSSTGTLISSVAVSNTGGWSNYVTFSNTLNTSVTGTHDLYLTFVGSGSSALLTVESFTVLSSPGDLGVLFTATTCDQESAPSNANIITIAGPKIGKIVNNSWVRYDAFDFGSGASSIEINAGAVGSGGSIEVRTDSSTEALLGTVTVTNTGGWNTFLPFTASLSGATGVEDLYFVFVGGSGFFLTVESFQVD